MMKLFCSIFVVILTSLTPVFATESFRSSIFQIIAYRYDTQEQTYIPQQYGSSISLIGGSVITNAHVVLDEKQEPLTAFEVCGIVDHTDRPKCFGSATLLYYDPDIDLAMLKINMPYTAPSPQFADTDATIGSVTLVKGFPNYGLGTMTTTRGVIAGEYGDYQKIDADLDQGNSGGASFDEKFRLIGMPTFFVQGINTLGYIIPISKIKEFVAKKGIIMYPSKKTEAQFQTYLNKRHKQLRSSIIDDRHFSLVIPNGFYLKDLIWTHDRNLAQYQLMSKNQNVSININTSQSLGPQISQYQELKQKIIKDAQEYFDDVSYTQYAHKNHIYNQLIAKGTESDKFTATANTFIFKDQSYGINIHVNGKTFDKNFQKGIDIAKSINIKHTDHIKSSGALEMYGLTIPLIDGIEIHKSIDFQGISRQLHILYQDDIAHIDIQELSLKRLQTIKLDENTLVNNEGEKISKTRLVKNMNNVLMIITQEIDTHQQETYISVKIPVLYDTKVYLISIYRTLSHDRPDDIVKIYTLLDKISLNGKQIGSFKYAPIGITEFQNLKGNNLKSDQ